MAVTNYVSMDGMLIGEMTNGVMRNYGTDALGSVVETVLNGVEENTYQYKPYGGLLAKTGVATDPSFLWNGGSGYRATNLTNSDFYIRHRHYSSTKSSWSSVDLLWPIERAYSYVWNGCITHTDPSGHADCRQGRQTCDKFPKGILGFTECCVDTGIVYSVFCTDKCSDKCTRVHEGLHVRELTPCCSLAGLCFSSAKGNTTKENNCLAAYDTWYSRHAVIFECDAANVTFICDLNNLLTGCKGGSNEVGSTAKNDPCCKSWADQLAIDHQGSDDYCANAQLWLSKKNKQDMNCPFNADGSVRSNYK